MPDGEHELLRGGVVQLFPGVRVYAPADAAETEAVMPRFLGEPGVAYLRIGRGGEPVFSDAAALSGYQTGKAVPHSDGTDAYILTAGGILGSAVDAAERLKARGYSVGVASFPTVKPIDEAYLTALCAKAPVLFTLEEHTIVGGFGGAVCEFVCGLRENRARVVRIGLNDTYCSIVGDQKYLEKAFGLDGESVADRVQAALEGKA